MGALNGSPSRSVVPVNVIGNKLLGIIGRSELGDVPMMSRPVGTTMKVSQMPWPPEN